MAVDRKGRIWEYGLLLPEYNHICTLGSTEVQVVFISPEAKIVDVLLQEVKVTGCGNWAVEQDVICIESHETSRWGDCCHVVDIDDKE